MGGAPYRSTKDGDWAYSCINHERASCLQRIDALEHAMEPPAPVQ